MIGHYSAREWQLLISCSTCEWYVRWYSRNFDWTQLFLPNRRFRYRIVTKTDSVNKRYADTKDSAVVSVLDRRRLCVPDTGLRVMINQAVQISTYYRFELLARPDATKQGSVNWHREWAIGNRPKVSHMMLNIKICFSLWYNAQYLTSARKPTSRQLSLLHDIKN